mgnify:CR=1 FL=1
MSDQRRISREQVIEGLRSRSGGREVGYLRHAERLVATGWPEKEAGRYAELYQLWLESRRNPAAQLHPKELAEARRLEKKYGTGADFAILREPPVQP